MKTISVEQATLATCVEDAQGEQIVVTRSGKPVALVIGVAGMDAEHVELGADVAFWEFIQTRRLQPTVGRGELEQMLDAFSTDVNGSGAQKR